MLNIHSCSIARCMHWLLYALLAGFLNGCATLSYYQQAIGGQIELLQKRKPIAAVLKDQDIDATIKTRLHLIQKARVFAVNDLMLPDNDSYKDYADLGRPYAMWSVFVTPAYSLKPRQWCYPLLGCVSYRSYFSQGQAQAYADSMQSRGYDVYIAGVPAYSTLGWFDDPVLNTMMHWQDYDLVGTLFHELAHQKFYIKDETIFNESLAKAIEQEGLRRWMDAQTDAGQYQKYLLESEREKAFIELILASRKKLQELYQSELPEDEMFKGKMQIFRSMRAAYLQLRQRWGGYDVYDDWMLSGVNNAKVQSIATYYDYVPAFIKMLQQQQGNIGNFYQEIETLMQQTAEDRRVHLLELSIDRIEQ